MLKPCGQLRRPVLTDWNEVASGAALLADGRVVPTAPIADRLFAFVLDAAGVDPWGLPIPYQATSEGQP
ncbi:hypothetical protein IV102_37660 [bacterium]|nr:hypothetical protein [bacterium]